LSNTDASDNTAVGFAALASLTGGGTNTAVGSQALTSHTSGGSNTRVGYQALASHLNGSANTAVGVQALFNNTTGSFNTALGFAAGGGLTTAGNVICIGATGVNVVDSCFIGNIWTQPGGSQAVFVNSDGKLGAQVSSRRFKDRIKPMDKASEALFSLKPVSFH